MWGTYDVLAPRGDDELLDASRDGPEAVGVLVRHVPTVQPALLVDRLVRLLLLAEKP